MKTRLIIVTVLILMLFSFACKKKAGQIPDQEMAEQITTFAPLPSFKEVYSTLDQVQVKDIAAAVPATTYKAKQEEVRNAFSLGLLTADAVLATKGRNKSKLSDISAQMMTLTELLGLESEVNRLGDDMKTMIEKEEWDNLDKALDAHKEEVEIKLWESENFDNYTLMLMGGWIEAANRIAWLINQNYSAERTKVLAQKGTFNHLLNNLKQIKTEYIVEQDAFIKAVSTTEELKNLIDHDLDSTYTKEQIAEIIAKTDAIKAAFQE
ncbi:MAG: hypothetical protein PHO85_00925 [Candidatus Cloacimonetes bacterium]|jgi:hypothetical protein|nr:hypothetical protein [Candidatus Cloacimonadota bacterium]MDD2506653.1 hypothetical protein [Candidatus Cloacimonadota bacterium]MDD4147070.1 hypothetical protein [Candidatus Cloacimonadota bacterium]MDD4560269.1 hypothetical protein [Candidatus Cloacimonadota bacterium]